MSKDKEIISKLVKVVAQQQQIITKIAQSLGDALPPASLNPQITTKKEAEAISNALPQQVKSLVRRLEVAPGTSSNTVKVQFVPGKSSDYAFRTIQKVVTTLQQQNVLPGIAYNVVEVPV